MDGPAEKRLLERYRVDFGVICRSRGQEQPGRALNLSRGGVLLATGSLVPVGTLTEVILAVAGAEVLQFKGIVRHTTQDMGMGIEFVEVLPNYQARLVAYLSTLELAPGSAAAVH